MATIYKRGNKYFVQVRVAGHSSQSKTFSTKAAAKNWAAETELELRKLAGPKPEEVTVGYALSRYSQEVSILKRGVRSEQVRIKRIISVLPEHRLIKDFTVEDAKTFRDQRATEVGPASILREIAILRSAWAHFVSEWRYCYKNVWQEIKKPKTPPHRERLVTDEEIEQMLTSLRHFEGAGERSAMQRVALVMLWALETGMRAGEICTLTHEDVDLFCLSWNWTTPNLKKGINSL